MVNLPDDAVDKTLLDAHEVDSTTSSTLEVNASRAECPELIGHAEALVDRGIVRAHRRADDRAALLRRARAGATGGLGVGAAALGRVGRRGIGVILFLREVGFSLAEIGSFVAGGERWSWQEIIDQKLTEKQHRLNVARDALEHARRCPAGKPMRCSRFWSIIEGQMRGLSLEEKPHARALTPFTHMLAAEAIERQFDNLPPDGRPARDGRSSLVVLRLITECFR
jgi:DNA-binding transcriptional MerR regulator